MKLEEFQPPSEMNYIYQIQPCRRYYKVGFNQAMGSSRMRKWPGHVLAVTHYTEDQEVDSYSELSQPSDKHEMQFLTFHKCTVLRVHFGLLFHVYIPVVQ